MGSKSFVVVANSSASPERVWELLADATSWPRWSRVPAARYKREGEPAPHGVGAIRDFGAGPVHSFEEVILFDPPRHLAYQLLSGLPIDGYCADVQLIPVGSGTRIEWAGTFDAKPRFLGSLWKFVLARILIRGLANSLSKAAESSES